MGTVGVVLAGGSGRRLGGAKATAVLGGVPLLNHPLRALAEVTPSQAVVAKRDTALPSLPAAVAVWIEPDAPRHPLTGVLHALRSAGGRAVLCCAVDMPLLDAATLQRLLDADDGRSACIVPRAAGSLEPLCALWHPRATGTLERVPGEAPMRDVVAALDALEVGFDDRRPFANVNTPDELRALRPAFVQEARGRAPRVGGPAGRPDLP